MISGLIMFEFYLCETNPGIYQCLKMDEKSSTLINRLWKDGGLSSNKKRETIMTIHKTLELIVTSIMLSDC